DSKIFSMPAILLRRITRLFPKRLFQTRALRGEQLGAIVGDVHVIFQAYAKFSAQVDSRLVAEAHARLEQSLVATHQVGPLVAVHADAVAQPVGEMLIIAAVARI